MIQNSLTSLVSKKKQKTLHIFNSVHSTDESSLKLLDNYESLETIKLYILLNNDKGLIPSIYLYSLIK